MPDLSQELTSDCGASESLPTPDTAEPHFFSVILRQRHLVLRWTALGAIFSCLISLLIPAGYESRAQLMPPEQNASGMMIGLAMERAQSMGIPPEMLGAKTSGALFVKILTSETLQNALVEKFDLRRVYGTRYWDTARKKLTGNTYVSEDRKSGVITIRIRDRNPERARAICGAYVDELSRLSVQLSTSAARREREFLEQRLLLVKREVNESESRLGEFSSKNSTMDIPQQSKAMVEAAATLEGKLIAAESELEGLKKVYGDENVRVKTLKGSVDELRRNVRELSGTESSVSPVSGMPSLRKLPLLGVTYVDLLRQVKISEAVLEALTKQYELARVQEAKDVPSVRMLDRPSLPERRAYPPRLALTILGGFMGGAAGLFWALWLALDGDDPRRRLVRQINRNLRGDFSTLLSHVRRVNNA